MPSYSFHYASRLNSFKTRPELFNWQVGPADLGDLIRRAGQVKALDSITLNYPEHFKHYTPAELAARVATTHLKMSAINLRYPDSLGAGALTNPDPEKRRYAVQVTCEAADACRQMGANHLVLWLSYDGFDYPFQADYARLWDWEIEGLRQVTQCASDLRLSIEYKPADPRRFSLLNDIGSTLLAVREVGAPNLGVTLDFCHQLMAHENPAYSAALCARSSQLYGIHLNDGYGSLDDGLMAGSVNLLQTLELIYTLVQAGYDDVIYFDTFPTLEDPVMECAANIQRVHQLTKAVAQLAGPEWQAAVAAQDALEVNRLLWQVLWGQK